MRIIQVDVTGWNVNAIVACLITHDRPRGAEPQIYYLSDQALAPLIECGVLTRFERLRLLALTPGWQP